MLSSKQKDRFLNLPGGPTSRDDVINLYNFESIRDSNEKPNLIGAVISGSENSGCTTGSFFINYD